MTATTERLSEFDRPLPSGAPGIELKGIGLVLRGGRQLYDGFDLDIVSGRTTCLLGPSGIGKSMLLKLIAGLAGPDAIDDNGKHGAIRASDGAPLAPRMAYMAQQDLLLPWLDAARNVMLGHRLRGSQTADAEDKAAALLDAVGLGADAARYPVELSGGMRQRVALARTLAEDRPVVLMDEPFSQLDAITRLKLQTLAARLLAGRTVLMVTHDPLEALRLANRIVVLGGAPAGIVAVHNIEGEPPRDPATTEMLRRHADLLGALGGDAP